MFLKSKKIAFVLLKCLICSSDPPKTQYMQVLLWFKKRELFLVNLNILKMLQNVHFLNKMYRKTNQSEHYNYNKQLIFNLNNCLINIYMFLGLSPRNDAMFAREDI